MFKKDMSYQERSCTTKCSHDSEELARESIRKIQEYNNVDLREYKCVYCSKYHLTSHIPKLLKDNDNLRSFNDSIGRLGKLRVKLNSIVED